MAKIYDDVEIGLTMVELEQALSAWVGCKTSIYDHRVSGVVMTPRGQIVIRFTVQPPLTAKTKKALEDAPRLQSETVD